MAHFLLSFQATLSFLTSPTVLLTVLVFLLCFLAFAGAIRYFSEQKESEEGAAAGCLTQIIAVFVQGVFVAVFVMLTMPLLLGVSSQISWTAVEPLGFVAARAGLIAVLAVSILTMIPVLGLALAQSPGLETFLLAVTVFRLSAPVYLSSFIKDGNQSNLFPNFWQSILCLAFVIFVTRIAMALIFIISKYLAQRHQEKWSTFFMQTLGPALDVLIGLFGFFLYTQHLSLVLNS